MKIGFVVLIILIFSCSTENIELKKETKFSLLSKESNTEVFDSVFTLRENIILQVDKDHIISSVKQLCLTESEYIILDTRGKQILVFNKKGMLKNTIGTVGSGPGEYKNIVSMDVFGDQIIVLDAANLRISKFNIKGILLNSFNVRQGFCISLNTMGGLFVYNPNLPNAKDVFVIDYYTKEGNYEKSFCPSFYNLPAMSKSLIQSNTIGDLFIIHPSEYKVVKFDPNLSIQTEFASVPHHYKKPPMKPGQLPTIKELNESTALKGIFVNNSYILVELFRSDPMNFWIDIYDLNGNIIYSSIEVKNNLSIAYIDNLNFVYFIKNPSFSNTKQSFNLDDFEIIKYKLLI